MGKAMFGMIGVMAEFERSLIQERVKAGLRNAKAKGRLLGRKKGAISKNARSRTTLWRRKRAAAAAATVGNENSVTPTGWAVRADARAQRRETASGIPRPRFCA